MAVKRLAAACSDASLWLLLAMSATAVALLARCPRAGLCLPVAQWQCDAVLSARVRHRSCSLSWAWLGMRLWRALSFASLEAAFRAGARSRHLRACWHARGSCKCVLRRGAAEVSRASCKAVGSTLPVRRLRKPLLEAAPANHRRAADAPEWMNVLGHHRAVRYLQLKALAAVTPGLCGRRRTLVRHSLPMI